MVEHLSLRRIDFRRSENGLRSEKRAGARMDIRSEYVREGWILSNRYVDLMMFGRGGVVRNNEGLLTDDFAKIIDGRPGHGKSRRCGRSVMVLGEGGGTRRAITTTGHIHHRTI